MYDSILGSSEWYAIHKLRAEPPSRGRRASGTPLAVGGAYHDWLANQNDRGAPSPPPQNQVIYSDVTELIFFFCSAIMYINGVYYDFWINGHSIREPLNPLI